MHGRAKIHDLRAARCKRIAHDRGTDGGELRLEIVVPEAVSDEHGVVRTGMEHDLRRAVCEILGDGCERLCVDRL